MYKKFKSRRSLGANRQKKEFFDMSVFVRKAQAVRLESYFPSHTFSNLQLSDTLQKNISIRGYTSLTPIQDQVIPIVFRGHDVIGQANTGSGKTAAFLLPLIQMASQSKSRRVLIVAPTRELATQINDEFRIFAKGMGIYSTVCIGGLSLRQQVRDIERKPQFVIGTPGRLKDLENQNFLKLNEFTTIVMDEVDRMLDMGFIHDMKYLIAKMPQNRQSLGFSATLTPAIVEVLNSFTRNPLHVTIPSQSSAVNVDQDVVHTTGRPKIEVLHELLIKDGFDKVLVFGRTKWGINHLVKDLETRGFKVEAIHGNKSQGQRQRALAEFKNNRIKVLLATDIASRGLDIDGVTHVINYDLPESYEDYVHRIGRTARAGKTGVAITFVN